MVMRGSSSLRTAAVQSSAAFIARTSPPQAEAIYEVTAFEPDFFAEVFRQNAECAVYGAGDSPLFHGLELKHRGAA